MIRYASEPGLEAGEFRAVLEASGLAGRRPAQDLARLSAMLANAQVIITARDHDRLVGISRAITDFAYCCYLSDLAVDRDYQRQGIGKRLIEETRQAAGPGTSLFLVAAPAAEAYYPAIGMTHVPRCWSRPRSQ